MLVANRSGAVLGPHTILKEDHFPGCQSPHLPPSIPGVPNFRGVGVCLSGSQLPGAELMEVPAQVEYGVRMNPMYAGLSVCMSVAAGASSNSHAMTRMLHRNL